MYPQSLRLVIEEEMETQWTFDSDFTRGYTKVRQAFTAGLLEEIRKEIDIASALDVGCGVGYFSKFLSDMRLEVTAIDGREENIAEAKRRYPEITFITRNVEDSTLPEIGSFDFVLCVGLLYHLRSVVSPGKPSSCHTKSARDDRQGSFGGIDVHPQERCEHGAA